MSLLSATAVPWRRRVRRADATATGATAGVPADVTAVPTLAGLTTGESARVLDVQAPHDPAGARRLFDLGFVPGAEVRMVRRAPLADPVIFRVAGYDIALRREQARWVTVAASAAPAS